jgi:hypothetical protein
VSTQVTSPTDQSVSDISDMWCGMMSTHASTSWPHVHTCNTRSYSAHFEGEC